MHYQYDFYRVQIIFSYIVIMLPNQSQFFTNWLLP